MTAPTITVNPPSGVSPNTAFTATGSFSGYTLTGTTGTITDAAGNNWAINTAGNATFNTNILGFTTNVVQLAFVNGSMWQQNNLNFWYKFIVSGTTVTDSGTQYTVSPIVPPTLTYSDNGGAAQALPSGATVTTTSFSFTHPGLATGSYALVISDGSFSGSTSYAVGTAGWIALPATSGLTGTITGLIAATTYNVEVYATNAAGQGPFSVVLPVTTSGASAVLPGAPTSLTSTATTQTAVSLSWVAPTTGTTPFTYQPQYSLAGANSWSNGTVVSVLSVQITGLSTGVSYDFRVAAINAAGTGPQSVIYTVATASAPPVTVTWQPSGATSTIAFSNGNLTATAGGAATPYVAQQACVSTTSQSSGSFSFEVTMSTITQNCSLGLAGATHPLSTDLGLDALSIGYYMSTGTGSQAAQTVFYGGANAVLTPSGTPAADVGGATFTFCVTLASGGSTLWVSSPAMRTAYGANAWNDSATANPATNTGGIAFSIAGALSICFTTSEGTAVATLNAGSSAFVRAASIPSNFVPWAGGSVTVLAPGAPTSLAAGTPASNAVTLTWVAPVTGTQPLTYLVLQSPGGANTFTQVASVTTLTTTVANLNVSTPYDFEVKATNSAGTSVASNIVPITTAASGAVPGAPSALSAGTATATTIPLTWVAPTTGGAPVSYQVQLKPTSAQSYTNYTPTLPALQTLTGTTGSITDAAGNRWAINGSAVATFNGGTLGFTSSVVELAYVNGSMWQENNLNFWYLFNVNGSTVTDSGTQYTVSPIVNPAQTISGLTASTPYNFDVVAINASGSGPASSPAITASTTSVSTLFAVSNGQIKAPGGSVFVAKGININDVDIGIAMTSAAGGPMTTLFPGINFVRLACNSYGSAASYANFINWCTGFNPPIVVVLDQHQNFHANGTSAGTSGGGMGVVLTGSLLNTEQAWFTSMATTYGTNPYVWYGTSNEPPGPGTHFVSGGADADASLASLSTWHQTTYNTIRAKAPSSIILIDMWGAGHPLDGSMTAAGVPVGQDYSGNGTGVTTTPGPMTASVYAVMHNVVWDWHQYGWMFGAQNATVAQSAIQTSQLSVISGLQSGFTSADGVIPVLAAEAGNSTTGASIDVSGERMVLATIANVRKASGAFCGAGFWEWNNGGVLGDRLTSNSAPWTVTSPYGADVALFCKTVF